MSLSRLNRYGGMISRVLSGGATILYTSADTGETFEVPDCFNVDEAQEVTGDDGIPRLIATPCLKVHDADLPVSPKAGDTFSALGKVFMVRSRQRTGMGRIALWSEMVL